MALIFPGVGNNWWGIPFVSPDDIGDHSMSCWVYITNADPGLTSYSSLLMINTAGSYNMDGFVLQNYPAINFYSNQASIGNNPSFSLNAWHHMALAWSKTDGTVNAYLDGVNHGTATYAADTQSISNITINSRDGTSGAGLASEATMSHAAIWRKGLLPAQISQLAQGANPLEVDHESLWYYWPLENDFRDVGPMRQGMGLLSGSVDPTWGPGPPQVQKFRRVRRYYAVTSSGNTALAGNLTSTSTLSAALSTQIQLNSALSSSSAIGASLTTAILLQSALSSSSSLSGTLGASAALTSALSSTSTLQGDLSTQIELASALSSSSVLQGALSGSGGGAVLASILTSSSSLAGNLSTQIRLASALTSSSSLLGGFYAPPQPIESGLTSSSTLLGGLSFYLPALLDAPAINAAWGLIQQFTTYSATPVQDAVGTWTYGWGSVIDPQGRRVGRLTPPISDSIAAVLALRALVRMHSAIFPLLPAGYTQGQLGALLDFAYDLSLVNLLPSQLLLSFQEGNLSVAYEQFPVWVFGPNGQYSATRAARRAAEQVLWLEPG